MVAALEALMVVALDGVCRCGEGRGRASCGGGEAHIIKVLEVENGGLALVGVVMECVGHDEDGEGSESGGKLGT